jgi:hypothetical protein
LYVSRVLAATIRGKTVPEEFQTEAQCFGNYLCFHYQGMMEAEAISEMLGWATVQTRLALMPVFIEFSH